MAVDSADLLLSYPRITNSIACDHYTNKDHSYISPNSTYAFYALPIDEFASSLTKEMNEIKLKNKFLMVRTETLESKHSDANILWEEKHNKLSIQHEEALSKHR